MSEWICDGQVDCLGAEDESSCGNRTNTHHANTHWFNGHFSGSRGWGML